MKDLKISVTCQCRACDGEGYTRNPLWDQFYAWDTQWEKANPEPPDEEAGDQWYRRKEQAEADWWAKRGYPGWPRKAPPEEPECRTCQGTGREAVELPLEALARYLGIEAGWPA